MRISPLASPLVTAKSITLAKLLDAVLGEFGDGSILAVTSKIVSLCEGRTVEVGSIDKEELIRREADFYLPPENSAYRYHATIIGGTLISMAGIDESNAGGDVYVLWPEDAQRSANEIRHYLRNRFGVTRAGVIIVDSVNQPLRRGTAGVALAYSGFKPIHDYRHQPDLFGRTMKVTVANVCGGFAAAANVVMGEGAEGRPFVVLADLPAVEFQDADPTVEELAEYFVPMKDDLFAPFLLSVPWVQRKSE